MDSIFLPRKVALLNKKTFLPRKVALLKKKTPWADLPPELLATISDGLQNPIDIIRFRLVCRSWRFSTPPPANKLSPFFPLTLPYTTYQHTHPSLTIGASAVYLLRPRHDPSKAWMVSAEEPVAGKLVLRHTLTYAEIAGASWEGLSSNDWIITEVSRSISHKRVCVRCNGILGIKKVAFVTNSDSGVLHCLCKIDGWHSHASMFFKLGLDGVAREIDCPRLTEFAKFKGWMYGIHRRGYLYLLDHEKARLRRITRRGFQGKYRCSECMWLVVSEGELFVILSHKFHSTRFKIYRLGIIKYHNGVITGGEWMEVNDLGERVFFLSKNCSFSMSARDLPRPWKGNCVVVNPNSGYVRCNCYTSLYYKEKEGTVFFLGGQHRRRPRQISWLQGYSDLFNPPLSWTDYA